MTLIKIFQQTLCSIVNSGIVLKLFKPFNRDVFLQVSPKHPEAKFFEVRRTELDSDYYMGNLELTVSKTRRTTLGAH